MTEDVVNSILDWIDSDEDIRTGGAEAEYYSTLAVPYEPRNAPMESIDELLMIQGVTPQLFYGEDANRNGVLDPNENDGDSLPPNDNGDGILDIGWRDYFTVASRERNLRADGSERINLNQGLMTELYDAIEPEFGEECSSVHRGLPAVRKCQRGCRHSAEPDGCTERRSDRSGQGRDRRSRGICDSRRNGPDQGCRVLVPFNL